MKRSIRSGKAARLPESVHQQLNKYALAAGAAGVGVLALGQLAEAKIVYTPADAKITPDRVIPLDLNHDGVVDFRFKDVYQRSHPYGFDHTGLLSVVPANQANEVVGFTRVNGNYASALRAGASIGPNARFLAGANQMEEAFIDTGRDPNNNGTCFSTWPSGQTRYLGLRFVVDGEVHFGWARLRVGCSGLHVLATLTGYAYETIANKAIVAGQETGTDREASAVPDISVGGPARSTAPLGVLALGSNGLSVWRREEDQ
jgi:hypothetical protein